MLKKILILVPLLLYGCSESLSPSRCQYLGVAVEDNDTITGQIIKENIAEQKVVQAKCQSPFTYKEGCALAVGSNSYIIWRIDDPVVRDHEKCHALYEEGRHI